MLYAVIFYCMPDDLPILLSFMFSFKYADSIELRSVISLVIGEWWIEKNLEVSGPNLTL